jgi:hypothetical protein
MEVITKGLFIFGLTTDASKRDISICVPLEDIRQTQEAFSAEVKLCAPFRPGKSRSIPTLQGQRHAPVFLPGS